MLRTRFTEMFGLAYPVMSAPMALHSGGRLAGGGSAAGGPRAFRAIPPPQSPHWVRAGIAPIRRQSDGPFAVGYITAFLPMFEKLFDAALTAATPPAVIALSFGDPRPWMERAKQAGIATMCQVQTLDQAARVVDAGAD